MLNKSGITKTTLTAPTQILANVELQASIGCVVAKSAGVTVGSKTIVKAGTPVTGGLDTFNQLLFTAAVTTAGVSNAVGIILHLIS